MTEDRADVCLRAPPVSPLYKTGTFPSSCYKTAPAGFHLGHWYRNYETFATWNLRRNNQLLATGSTNSSIYKIDQITYQVPGNCTHLDSIYGFETYTSISDVQTFHGTGLFAGISGPIETVAWGLDEKCEKYVVYYEWDGSATYGWTIITEAVDGPTPGTLASIEKQIKTVANGAWANITMYSSVHDGARNGQPYPVCDQACLTNNNSPNGTCPPS